jgi:hypothetical protein
MDGWMDDARTDWPAGAPNWILTCSHFISLSLPSENVRAHSANTHHQQFTLGPLLDLVHLSSSMAVIGTCNSTFSASAGVVGA